MPHSRSHSFTIALRVVVLLPDDEIEPSSIVTEQNLADPDTSIDAAMDYALPHDGNPEIFRQTQSRILAYMGWLLGEVRARYPSWAEDELAARHDPPGRSAGGGGVRVPETALIVRPPGASCSPHREHGSPGAVIARPGLFDIRQRNRVGRDC